MRRIIPFALAAALMLVSAPAVLAQPGPPADPGSAAAEHRPEAAQDHAEDGAENRQQGMDASQEGRDRASERSGMQVPVNEEAREGGRDFGQQRAEDAQQRGDTEEPVEGEEPVDAEEPVEGEDPVEGENPVGDEADAQSLLDDVELPDEVGPAGGVLASITAVFDQILESLRGLFG